MFHVDAARSPFHPDLVQTQLLKNEVWLPVRKFPAFLYRLQLPPPSLSATICKSVISILRPGRAPR